MSTLNRSAILVTIVVPTKNSGRTLARCLASIRNQSHPSIEVIVVDNFSTDDTPAIATAAGVHFFQRGPERSAQRNYGIKLARGAYTLVIDSDMYLNPFLVSDALDVVASGAEGVVLPEESVGDGFWARCKWLERACYENEPLIEALRFFRTDLLRKLGGYDERLHAFEDWDLHNRYLAEHYRIDRASRDRGLILHDEGHLSLKRTLNKKTYYGQSSLAYTAKHPARAKAQLSPVVRIAIFLKHWPLLVAHPVLASGMVFMKLAEAYSARARTLSSSHIYGA